MAGSRLQVVGWRARRLVDVVNPLVWLAAGLTLVEVLFYFGLLAPLHRHEAALLDDALRHRQSKTDREHEKPAPHLLATDMTTFYKTLPRTTDASRMLRQLHEIADEAGAWIDQADYRPFRDNDSKLVLYEITLPAKGTYPELRQFLARAIRELPGLAVEGVAFHRQRVDEAELDAQIKLTLFMSTPGM